MRSSFNKLLVPNSFNTHTVVVGEDGELDDVGLGQIGIHFGSSDRRPVVESNWDVVPETLLTGTEYQAFRFQVVIHFFVELKLLSFHTWCNYSATTI